MRQQQPDLPESDSIFEYRLEVKSGNWSHWNDYIPSWTYPGDDKLEFSTLFISTLDSSRCELAASKNRAKPLSAAVSERDGLLTVCEWVSD